MTVKNIAAPLRRERVGRLAQKEQALRAPHSPRVIRIKLSSLTAKVA